MNTLVHARVRFKQLLSWPNLLWWCLGIVLLHTLNVATAFTLGAQTGRIDAPELGAAAPWMTILAAVLPAWTLSRMGTKGDKDELRRVLLPISTRDRRMADLVVWLVPCLLAFASVVAFYVWATWGRPPDGAALEPMVFMGATAWFAAMSMRVTDERHLIAGAIMMALMVVVPPTSPLGILVPVVATLITFRIPSRWVDRASQAWHNLGAAHLAAPKPHQSAGSAMGRDVGKRMVGAAIATVAALVVIWVTTGVFVTELDPESLLGLIVLVVPLGAILATVTTFASIHHRAFHSTALLPIAPLEVVTRFLVPTVVASVVGGAAWSAFWLTMGDSPSSVLPAGVTLLVGGIAIGSASAQIHIRRPGWFSYLAPTALVLAYVWCNFAAVTQDGILTWMSASIAWLLLLPALASPWLTLHSTGQWTQQ